VDAVQDGVGIARSCGDAPDIDGVVRIHGGSKLKIGDFVRVEVTGADTYDLEARIQDS